ncbi:src kinase-associated phosphoprotein 2-like [Saccostrea cucullata]|uniref:src kinase-associated phosphoprotein 2-like n=1 Tax=Saccostrea cuccullata TaxID=36930 RepID=UPI002ED12805
MTTIYETFKEFLIDVEKFLVETIKKESLSKSSKDHKQTILDKIGRLRDEFPQLTPEKPIDDTKSGDLSFTDESTRTGGSSNAEDEDQYGDANIPAIPAQDLTDTFKCGFLDKKQKKGKLLFSGPKLQKRWCAIKNNIFYYYESAKERKQHGAFYLNGYTVEDAPDVVDKKDAARRDLGFQLVCPAKRTYQFVAQSKEDYEDWKVAIMKGALSASSKDNILNDDEPGEVYEDVDNADNVDAAPEELYDDTLEEPEPSPKPVSRGPPSIPRPPPPDEPTCDEIYDDTVNPEDAQEEYDDCLTGQQPPPTPSRSLPEIPGSKKPLPAVPPTPPPSTHKPHPSNPAPSIPTTEVPKETKPAKNAEPQIPPDQDYENMFLGKYDCSADRNNELAFKRGDKLYVISRKYDDKSWWVAELNGKFGLVPKNYLTPAYELAR